MKRFALLFVNGFTLRDRFYVQAKDKDVPRETTSEMRTDYLSWEDYFMGIALLAAQRSKDPRTQVGACIVNRDKRIVGIGYNGMPEIISDKEAPWDRDGKKPYVCHAEMNAVVFRNAVSVKGCKMYVTLFPCNECAKIIAQSGIKEVFYCTDKPEYTESRKFLKDAKIKVTQFKTERKEVILKFPDPDSN